jgi:hypothetical protein
MTSEGASGRMVRICHSGAFKTKSAVSTDDLSCLKVAESHA